MKAFPIFYNHLDLAQKLWKSLIKEGDWAIDATCGNGHDTLFLAKLCTWVIAIDVQKKAIENTRKLLLDNRLNNFSLFHQSHTTLSQIGKAQIAKKEKIRLIVYNFGYLPGSDKNVTTQVDSTLESVEQSCDMLAPGGALSLTCYPGHPEGKKEQEALLKASKELCRETWNISHHQWNNRQGSPSLLIYQKNI